MRFRRRHIPVLVLAAFLAAPAAAGAEARTVAAAADAWVNGDHPHRNYGDGASLRAAPKAQKRTFARFTVPSLDGEVERAVLRLWVRRSAPNGLQVRGTAAGWSEGRITHANAPAPGRWVAAVPGFRSQGTWLEIDVTSAIEGAGVVSFLVRAPDARRAARFASRESARAPRLVVETEEASPPDPPDPPDPDPDPDPDPTPGTVITTDRPWNCTGSLAAFGALPVKVVSTIANGGSNDNDNAVSLRGCFGDGDPATIDLVLDIRGNGGSVGNGSVGTSYDAVRIGQNAHDLVVTGNAECGARNPDPAVHQDIVQALSGSDITFVDFTSGDPQTGTWSCWGAGGGWYITWANAGRPTDLICLRCKLATYNQNMRIGDSLRSGARDSVFGFSRSYGIFIETVASSPVNANNQVIRY
jgi:hypothetical protein